jgi:hypothetical protein
MDATWQSGSGSIAAIFGWRITSEEQDPRISIYNCLLINKLGQTFCHDLQAILLTISPHSDARRNEFAVFGRSSRFLGMGLQPEMPEEREYEMQEIDALLL